MLKLIAITIMIAAVSVHAYTHVVKEDIQVVPSGWTQLSRASPDQSLDLIILIAQQNVAELESTLMRVSDPTHADYGQHLTHAEVNSLVAPTEAHASGVMQWVSSHGIRTTGATMDATPNRDMVRVTMTVAQAERLLHTEYYEFKHDDSQMQLVRALSYSVPSYLDDAIDVVGPTVRFPSHATIKGARKSHPKYVQTAAEKTGSACSQGTTPACLKQLYSVGDYVATSGNSSVAVTGYLEQYIAPTDLASFFAAFDPNHTRTATIIGPNVPASPGTEASLDIQYSMGMAPGVPGTFWYTAGRQPGSTDNEPFLNFLMALSSTSSVPWVISTSYGDNEPTVNYNYAVRMNVEFMKAGVRGISTLFSSGDGGVAGGQSSSCTTFIPTFPAGSPYVTAVGGTTQFNPEVAASFSSGGFANYWPTPSYQSTFVRGYITKYGQNLPAAGLWNHTGRGIPDVSAQGTNYPVYTGGWPSPVDGTSCSTPTFSGIVALLNDIRFAAGKSSLGFLNPLFYKNPNMFTDILSGNNPGCGTNGFECSQGWDPVTGLGTPNFVAMSSVIKALP